MGVGEKSEIIKINVALAVPSNVKTETEELLFFKMRE